MYDFPIGAIVDSFRCDTKEAVKKAAAIGIKGIQMYCTRGAHAPENFGKEQRRELLNFVKDNGMVFSAVCGDLGRGFGDPALNPELIEQSKRILDMAKDFETDIVTTHIGVVPSDQNHDRYKIMQEACASLLLMQTASVPILQLKRDRKLPPCLQHFWIRWIRPASR